MRIVLTSSHSLAPERNADLHLLKWSTNDILTKYYLVTKFTSKLSLQEIEVAYCINVGRSLKWSLKNQRYWFSSRRSRETTWGMWVTVVLRWQQTQSAVSEPRDVIAALMQTRRRQQFTFTEILPLPINYRHLEIDLMAYIPIAVEIVDRLNGLIPI